MGSQIPSPSVFMFKEDQEMMKELSTDGKASGDLFGLWSEIDKELVVHLATIHHSNELDESGKPSGQLKEKRKNMREEFGLFRVGKWLSKPNEFQTNRELVLIAKEMRKDPGLLARKKLTPKYVLIVITGENNSNGGDFSPYLVSKTQISTKAGKITILGGENEFRKVDKIGRLTGMDRARDPMEIEREAEKVPKASHPTHNTMSGHSAYPSVEQSFSHRRNRDYKASVTDQTDLRVFMYEEDIQKMQNLVLRYPDFETGGDLFGLWTSEGEAMFHVVLGPGKHCLRTDVSFNQDVPYLQRIGELLTEHFMLCHIGEWHSHHQLSLSQPSRGDNSTVIRNFPAGAQGFILIIANIKSPGLVTLSPFLYTQSSRTKYDKAGQIIPVKGPNGFNQISTIRVSMERGKETAIDEQNNNASLYHQQRSSYHLRSSRKKVTSSQRNLVARFDRADEPRERVRRPSSYVVAERVKQFERKRR
ncbi:PREDICTED: uncharacterized protein LOC107345577 [Acropora digitifera]|uniref:uncharacterized protein LOC107345577 n=1 Tax=Acropora digitifera TaxID=70779 RepID=UPI00077AC49A|nr:PREDICTED: uncharacterized protein LOC107345577 [Acropora digitifera]